MSLNAILDNSSNGIRCISSLLLKSGNKNLNLKRYEEEIAN